MLLSTLFVLQATIAVVDRGGERGYSILYRLEARDSKLDVGLGRSLTKCSGNEILQLLFQSGFFFCHCDKLFEMIY